MTRCDVYAGQGEKWEGQDSEYRSHGAGLGPMDMRGAVLQTLSHLDKP